MHPNVGEPTDNVALVSRLAALAPQPAVPFTGIHHHIGRPQDRAAHAGAMRIALVTETFYPAVDSTTTTLKATADRLVDLGHTVRIIAPGPGLASYRGCDVVRVRPLEPTGAQIRAAIDAFEPDLVQAASPRFVGRKALKHARRTGVPTLVVEQSPIHDLAADYWRAKVADRADTLLVTAPWMVGRVAELGAEAALWRPGVDSRAFAPTLRDPWLHDSWSRARSKDGAQVVVGYVGGLHKRHGVRRLTELADIPGIRLVRDRRRPGARVAGEAAARRPVHRPAPDRRPDDRAADPRRAGAPRRARDRLPRPARGRGVGGAGSGAALGRRRRRGAPPRDRASSTTRPTPATCAARSRRSRPTGIAGCSARPHATSRPGAPGSMPSTSW